MFARSFVNTGGVKVRTKKTQARRRRQRRVRKKVVGTADRPRLNVFRSARHIYAQLVRDDTGTTLAAASTLDPKVRKALTEGNKKEAAEKVGRLLAERALAGGIKQVVFDRGGYRYHGRVAALAKGAREGGLEF